VCNINFMNNVQQHSIMSPKHVRDKDAKIRLIFETFADLVNRNGYDRLSTRHVAEAAGISVGTIYHYFPGGKHAIASRYIDRVTDELFDPNIFMEIEEKDLRWFFDGLVRRYLFVHRESLEIHRAIDQAILADPDVRRRNREAIVTNMSKVVAELKDAGLYGSLPERSVLNGFILLFNILEGIIHRHLFVYSLFEAEEELISFLVNLLECLTKGGEFFSAMSAGGGI
jgi:AcrR family transcriptional regulator